MQERSAADAAQAPALGEIGARRPVYLLFPNGRQGDALALDLRHYGFKARNFVSLSVLRNAARSAPPAAVIADASVLGQPGEMRQALAEAGEVAGAEIPLLFIAEQDDLQTRLSAVRAGGNAFFRYPINRPALLHRLYQLPELHRRQQPTVLLVATAEDPARPLEGELRTLGLDVITCERPQDLLEALRDRPADLLLLAADQLGLDAAELVQTLRQVDGYQGLPVLLLTGGDKRRLDEAAANAGVDAIVGLPVETKDLAAVIRTRTQRAADLRSAYRYLAKRDPLTGLYNADYLLDSLRHTLASRRGANDTTALALLTLAAAPGSALEPLLVEAAEQLRRLLPPSAVAARLSDKDLAIIVYGLDAGALERLAGDLDEQLGGFEAGVGAASHSGGARVGMTILRSDESSPADAIARARRASTLGHEEVQSAAEAGRSDAELIEHWVQRLQVALERSRFRLVYQPIASLSGLPTSFYEVFLRLLDEEGRDVLPREFMPAAQRGGLGPALDRWVIERAVEVLGEQNAGSHRPVLFIKLFAESVADSTLASWIAERLRAHQLQAEQLVFEISERTANTRMAETAGLVRSLKDLGCRVAVEHFSDRSHGAELLRALEPHYLKLAAELTDDVVSSAEHQKRVQAVASQARAVGSRTIAALVQDASNLSVLWRCGVEYIQGYFMQEPADVFADDPEQEND